jgi:hypothetical protein
MQSSHRLFRIGGLPAALLVVRLVTAPIPAAQAQVNVYITSSENAVADTALMNRLTSFGHTVTLGAPWHQLNGTQSLAGIQTVYLQYNYNWSGAALQAAGETALINFVNSGGGLVTTEWLLWAGGGGPDLNPIHPSVPTGSFNSDASVTFGQVTPNPVLNAGLPASFDTALDNIAGTRTNIDAVRPGATIFYSANGASGNFHGLTGWNVGAGRVLNFTTVNGLDQVADPNFGRLLSNSLNFAAGPGASAAAPEPGALALLLVPLGIVARHRCRNRRSGL